MEPSASKETRTSKRSSILKKHSSPEKKRSDTATTSTGRVTIKTARFDEDNIKETYRPINKEYGFDKITEAKTPFEREQLPIDAKKLRKRLKPITDENLSSSSFISEAYSTESNKSKVSATISFTSGDFISFKEKRRNHIRAEYKIAKQAFEEEKIDDDQPTTSQGYV
ncbi:uncharacterized protein LOC129942115 [Eupeodes corollae]|uniref:uncharacterized protein LOC129942115 n=1 Tax=Eupeodes corollae TaxID=290404 RepID=UPI00249061E9|nr:uncharacterized protein LOC129942115 [Eupeodes corollae]